jgi:V8-like Glu-specific endopeptidase
MALTDLVLYGLNVPIDNIVPPGALNDRVRDLIVWTEAQGRTDEMLAAALNDVPKNAALRALAAGLDMDGGAGQFESTIKNWIPSIDVEEWRDGMIRSEQAVCRVEVDLTGEPEGAGTGFLISKNLVITNYHVMEAFILEQLDPARAFFHFDYKMRSGKPLKGVTYKPAENWRRHYSPADKLDFALVELADEAAEGTLGDQQNAPERGFLKPAAKGLKDGDPLMIIQHPKAVPQKFALGAVRVQTPPAAKEYVTYDVNTADGSSGSPCFSADWSLVALHHWGGQYHNRGIHFGAILEELDRKNIVLDS